VFISCDSESRTVAKPVTRQTAKAKKNKKTKTKKKTKKQKQNKKQKKTNLLRPI
jgi:hypothetical protein